MAAGHCREGGEVPSRRTQGEVSRCYDFEVKIHWNPMTLEVKKPPKVTNDGVFKLDQVVPFSNG